MNPPATEATKRAEPNPDTTRRRAQVKKSRVPTAILWLDVETTGLDPEVDVLLEIAVVATDAQLQELCRASFPVRHDRATLEAVIERPGRPEHVVKLIYDMHTANGLLEEVDGDQARPIWEIETELLELVEQAVARSPNPPEDDENGNPTHPYVLIGGCSPAFDKNFIEAYLPRFMELLHYRLIDATCLRFALQHWAGVEIPEPEKNHRALPDAINALNLARRTKVSFAPAGAPAPMPAPGTRAPIEPCSTDPLSNKPW